MAFAMASSACFATGTAALAGRSSSSNTRAQRSARRTATVQCKGGNNAKDWVSKMRGATVDAVKAARLITAIKTPYLPNGKVDLAAYDSLVEKQIEGGVEGLIVGGTTGEGQLMSWDEHIMLIAHTAKLYGDKVLIVGNTGSNSTREAVHATTQGFAVGMDAALQINPYYSKTSKAGILAHFGAVLDYGPTIVYNVPARTAQDIPPEIMFKLAEHPNFAGVKECEGNARIKGYTDKGVVCWTGNDDEAHDARYSAGAVGVISVTSNIVPGMMRQLMHDGENPELRDKLLPLMNWLFTEPNPIGLNTACAMLDCAQPVFRLPYVPYAADLRAKGAKIMLELGLEHTISPGPKLKDLEDKDFITLEEW